MQNKKRVIRVVIGRMSPFHIGHAALLNEASKDADELVVLVGSSNRSRSMRIPFTFDERRKMIIDWWNIEIRDTFLSIFPLEDNPYDDNEWMLNVQRIIATFMLNNGYTSNNSVVELVASDKESEGAYPNWFPMYRKITIPAFVGDSGTLSATSVRDSYFYEDYEHLDKIENSVPCTTMDFLGKFFNTDANSLLREDYKKIKAYRDAWKSAPFPPTLVTVDSVVVQSGHVLLIRRGDFPSKGSWALPGGFLNQEEKIRDACIRELVEETAVKIPAKVLSGSIVDYDYFDHPDRDPRGRTITHAFYIKLRDDEKLPHVKGSDDAAKAKWIPLSDLHGMRDQFFNDHYFILKRFLSL